MDLLHLNSFYEKMVYMSSESLYDSRLMEKYDREQIEELGKYMRKSRNNLFNYSALKLLSDKYLVQTDSYGILERLHLNSGPLQRRRGNMDHTRQRGRQVGFLLQQ